MNKKSWIIVLTGLLIILMIGAIMLYNLLTFRVSEETEPASEQKEEVIVKAPDFKVYKENGEEFYFSSLSGKPILIYTWTTWDDQCEVELLFVENAWKKYGDKVDFMVINLTEGKYETVEKVKAYVESHGYTFPVYYDKDLNVQAFAYNVLDVPMTVLVEKNGMISEQWTDAITEEKLFENIENLLGE